MMNIPARIMRPENNAETQLTAGITSIDTILNVADASRFPNSVFGAAQAPTPGEEPFRLNLVGIGALSPNGRVLQIGDPIINWTDGSYAFVETVNADFITTTCLKGGATNQWNNTDEFSNFPFVINVNKRVLNPTTNLEDITSQELMLCRYRDGNIVRVETRAFAETGKVGTPALAFAANDYVNIFQSAQHWHELAKGLAMLESNKMELNEKRDASFSGTMDFLNSAVLTNLPANPGDPNAPVVNSQLTSITATQAFSLKIQHPLEIFDPVLSWNNIVNSDPNFEYALFRRITSGTAEPRPGIGSGLLAVLPSSQITYTDTAASSAGPLNYNAYAIAYRPVGSTIGHTFSNTVQTQFDPAGAISSGFYGTGADGAYVPGTPLERNRIYNFTTFVTNLPVQITGDGTLPIVFVTGDIDIQAGANFSYIPSAIRDFSTSITVIRGGNPDVVADVSCGVGAGGAGGDGGNGGNSDVYSGIPGSVETGGPGGIPGQDGQAGSNMFVFGTAQPSGVGGLAGINGDTSTGGGSGGGGGARNGSCGSGTSGAPGVNGGVISGYNTSVFFLSGGNVTIANGVTFTMNGIAGTPGQNGQLAKTNVCATNCLAAPYSYSGIGGSSGGGGGSGGADGSKVVFCHAGTFTDNGSVGNYAGGAGGSGGLAGAAQAHPCQGLGGPADGFGQQGVSGVAGTAGIAGGLYSFQID